MHSVFTALMILALAQTGFRQPEAPAAPAVSNAPQAPVHVTGEVTGLNAAPVKATSIALTPVRTVGAVPLRVAVRPDGAFEFLQIPPGTYYIGLQPAADNFQRMLGVGATDLHGVRVPMQIPVFNVSGQAPADMQLKRQGQLPDGARLQLSLEDMRPMASTGAAAAAVPAQIGYFRQLPMSGPPMRQGVTTFTVEPSVDGAFLFRGIPPGSYRVTFAIAYGGGPASGAIARGGLFTSGGTDVFVNVADRDIAGVTVPRLVGLAAPSVNVSGRVKLTGDLPHPRFQLTFTGPGGVNTAVVEGPTFRAAITAGEQLVAVAGLPRGYTVESIFAGAADLLKGPYLADASGLPSIAITLTAASPAPWVEVRGRVINRTGTIPAAVGLVGALLADPLAAAIQPDGSFVFPMVLPDTYSVRMVPGVPNFTKTVVVGPGGIPNLELDASP